MESMIPGLAEKIKEGRTLILSHEKEIWVGVIVILAALLGFGLGRYSILPEKPPVRIVQSPASIALSLATSTDSAKSATTAPPPGKGSSAAVATAKASGMPSGVYYQGTRSTKKFRLSTCPGASSVSEKNRVIFKTKEAAIAAGYTPVKNCPGL